MIEKILERLEAEIEAYSDTTYYVYGLEAAKKIVQEVAKEYGNGWIPCSERLPDTNDAVNITWVNRKPMPYYRDIKDKPFAATGHYHNGKWYWYSCVCKDYLDEYGNSDMDEMDKDIEVTAWKPLDAPYQKGE